MLAMDVMVCLPLDAARAHYAEVIKYYRSRQTSLPFAVIKAMFVRTLLGYL